METCSRCSASSDTTVIYDAISNEGLVKICASCNIRENLPILRKAGAMPEEKRQTVYERMTRMSGYNPKLKEMRQREEQMKKQNEDIRQIMDRNFREEMMSSNFRKEAGGDDLVRNFHWEIMKARRAKHLTQRDLAEAIGESELAVRMAERGMLPRERERLVKKIENYLHIKISNMPEVSPSAAQPATSEEVPIEEIKKKFSIRDLFGLGKKKKEEENSGE